jgi:hypothetical protein
MSTIHRIVSHSDGYVIQVRILWFFWPHVYYPVQVYKTVEAAQEASLKIMNSGKVVKRITYD